MEKRGVRAKDAKDAKESKGRSAFPFCLGALRVLGAMLEAFQASSKAEGVGAPSLPMESIGQARRPSSARAISSGVWGWRWTYICGY